MIREAVFAVLPEAKRRAGATVAARTLFYKVRPLVQARLSDPGLKLDYKYFSQNLLPRYEGAFGPLPGLYYEASGELHHPHDDEVTKLGTREVEEYDPPPWQFDKVLYVEKTGLQAQLAPYQIGQRHDMAIIYGRGYSATACRNLLARSDIRDMQLFVLHDADRDGYNIARTLGEATRRMPDHNVNVIDLGLTVPQAIAEGLETETWIRKVALPNTLQLDDEALEWFTGEEIEDKSGTFECTRCELNAFSADGLAEFIEARLAAVGVAPKVVPPADVLAEAEEDARYAELYDLVTEVTDIDGVVRALMDRGGFAAVTEDRVRAWMADRPTRSWRAASRSLVRDGLDVRALTAAIRDLLAGG